MNKHFVKLACIGFILASFLSLSSCGNFFNGEQTDGEGSTTVQGSGVRGDEEINITDYTDQSVNTYQLVASSSLQQIGVPLTDGKNNYFYFKIGESKNVPIYYENGYHHNGITDSTYAWTQTGISSDTYSKVKSESVTQSTSTNVELSVNTSTEGSVSASYGGLGASVKTNVTTGLSGALNISHTTEEEQTFTHSVSQIYEQTKSRTVHIPKDAPRGFYRYVIYGNFDVYAAVVCNLETRKINYTYISVPRTYTFYDTFRYSQDNDFEVEGPAERLTLNEAALASIASELFSADLENMVDGYVYASVSYTSEKKRTITDAGYYGRGQVEKGDALNLTSLEQYMNGDYTFVFKVKVGAKCDSTFGVITKGNHEMHLYDRQYTVSTSKSMDEEMAAEGGWLGEIIWTTENGYDDFVWRVSGDKCKPAMYIYYDAHGEGEDTWILYYLRVVVEVIETK